MTTLEIYFDDLNDDAKAKILDFYGVDDVIKCTLMFVPLVILEKEEFIKVTVEENCGIDIKEI